MTAPARPSQARAAVIEAASGFSPLISTMPEAVMIADCGRVELDAPMWARAAQLTLLLLRQATVSAQATVARVDRTIEALEVLRSSCRQVGVVLIGGSPYPAAEVSAVLGVELFGVLPEDAVGAGLVCGAWTVGKRAARSPLAKAAAPLGARVVEAVYGRGHRFDPSPTEHPARSKDVGAADDQPRSATTDRSDARGDPARTAPRARAGDCGRGRQAGCPQGPGRAGARHPDVRRRREGRLGHRDPRRAGPLQRDPHARRATRRCPTSRTRPRSTR